MRLGIHVGPFSASTSTRRRRSQPRTVKQLPPDPDQVEMMALKQRAEYAIAHGQAANAAGDEDATLRWLEEAGQISAEMEWIAGGRHGPRPKVPPPKREEYFPQEAEQEASSEAQQRRLEREMGLGKDDLTGTEFECQVCGSSKYEVMPGQAPSGVTVRCAGCGARYAVTT
jgi:hypothetical protein